MGFQWIHACFTTLLWEERADLYKDYTTSAGILSWAQTTGYKCGMGNAGCGMTGDSALRTPNSAFILADVLSDYSPYAIGGSSTITPVTTYFQYLYDPSGWLKESIEIMNYLQAGEYRRNTARYDSDGNETYSSDEQGAFTFNLFKDRQGRVTKRTASGAYDAYFLIDLPSFLPVICNLLCKFEEKKGVQAPAPVGFVVLKNEESL